jgi:hypothetical protein
MLHSQLSMLTFETERPLMEFFQYLKWHVGVEEKVSRLNAHYKASNRLLRFLKLFSPQRQIRFFPLICILFPVRGV